MAALTSGSATCLPPPELAEWLQSDELDKVLELVGDGPVIPWVPIHLSRRLTHVFVDFMVFLFTFFLCKRSSSSSLVTAKDVGAGLVDIGVVSCSTWRREALNCGNCLRPKWMRLSRDSTPLTHEIFLHEIILHENCNHENFQIYGRCK